jgi:hypothetical protein
MAPLARLVLLAVLVAAALQAAAAVAAPGHVTSCWTGYSYDGVQSPTQGYGVAGGLTLNHPSSVDKGHVAAWLGVGGAGMGPGGTDEWVQAGIAHEQVGRDVLYYEFKRPGDAHATYVTLGNVVQRKTYSLVIYERAGHRDSWRVKLDGKVVGDNIVLPNSHGRFQPVATAENWDGGVAGSCNEYAFGFSGLSIRSHFGGGWSPFDLSRVLRDPAYRIALRASGFSATSR